MEQCGYSFFLKETLITATGNNRVSNQSLSITSIATWLSYFSLTHTHAHEHTHKAKPTAIAIQQRYLCTTQALEPCAGKSSWGRTSNPQEDCTGLTERGCRTQSSTTTPTPLSKTRAVGPLLPQETPGNHRCYCWLDWSNVRTHIRIHKHKHMHMHPSIFNTEINFYVLLLHYQNCCMKSASLHNVLDFYHYLSVNVITKMIW